MKERRLFPGWLASRDPFLDRTEENPVFQAFLAHREARARRGWRGTIAGLLPALPIPLVLFVGVVLAPFTGALSILLAMAGAVVLRIVRSQGVSRKSLLPYWVSNVFGTRLEQNILLDLWQTPNGARNYAEALLLEKRLRDWRFGSMCVLAILGTVELTCAVVSHPWSVGDLLLLAAIPLTTATLLPCAYWLGARNAAAEVRRRMEDLFLVDAIERAGQLAMQGVLKLLAFVGLMAGIVVASALVVMMFWQIVVKPLRGLEHYFEVRGTLGRMVSERVSDNAVQLVLAGIILLATLALGLLRPLARRWWQHTQQEAFALAELAIPFVIAHLQGDTEHQRNLLEERRSRQTTAPVAPGSSGYNFPVYSSPLFERALQEHRLA